MTKGRAMRIINRSLRRRNEIVSMRYAKRLMKAYAIYRGEEVNGLPLR